MLQVPYFSQNRDYTCGPVCLRMVLAYWGYETDEVSLSMLCGTTVFGTSATDYERCTTLGVSM
jgi:predicted double-glycine peptidase